MKCFTFGREVRRDKAGTVIKHSDKIQEIKKQFNRVGLIRLFFNKNTDNFTRKFINPVDDKGNP